jgi:hypothetical protein
MTTKATINNYQLEELECFLTYFLEGIYIIETENLENKANDTLEFSKRCDLITINKFVNIIDKECIHYAIKQGKEVVAMEPFPSEWVSDVVNRFPFNLDYHNTKDQDYKEWLQWLLDNLEIEAKKAGKI